MEWTSTKRIKGKFIGGIRLKDLTFDELEDEANKISFARLFYPNNMHYGEPMQPKQLRESQEAYNFLQITELQNCDKPCCMLKHAYIEQLKHGWNNSRLACNYTAYDSILYSLGWYYCDFVINQ